MRAIRWLHRAVRIFGDIKNAVQLLFLIIFLVGATVTALIAAAVAISRLPLWAGIALGVVVFLAVLVVEIAVLLLFSPARRQKIGQWPDIKEVEPATVPQRPSIEVEVINDPRDKMFLEVTNKGEHGEFEAQIEVLEGRYCIHGITRPLLPIYTGYWQRNAGPKASLPQGHKDRLMIGRLDMPSPRILLARFAMYFYDAVSQQLAEYGTTSWVPGSRQAKVARFLLQITISSTPGMKEGPFVKTYLLDGHDPKLQEMPQRAETDVSAQRIALKELLAKRQRILSNMMGQASPENQRQKEAQRTYELIEAALGKGEAEKWAIGSGRTVFHSQKDTEWTVKLKRLVPDLGDLISRIDTISTRSDFNPDDWR